MVVVPVIVVQSVLRIQVQHKYQLDISLVSCTMLNLFKDSPSCIWLRQFVYSMHLRFWLGLRNSLQPIAKLCSGSHERLS